MVWLRDNLTEQAEAPRQMAMLLVALGEGHRLLRTRQHIVKVPFEQACLAEPRKPHRPSHTH